MYIVYTNYFKMKFSLYNSDIWVSILTAIRVKIYENVCCLGKNVYLSNKL